MFAMLIGFSVAVAQTGHAAADKSGAKTVTFAASDVQYWVGTGSNSAVVVVCWDDNPNGNFALAWGVHWNGSATAANMLDSISAYDTRFSYSISGGFVTDMSYTDATHVSGSSNSWWCYGINNGGASGYTAQPMADGDLMVVSSSCGNTMTTAEAATNPNSTDATIAASSILYWVGEGSDSAIFVLMDGTNARARGYLFDESDGLSLDDMASDIAAADPRLVYSMLASYDMGYIYKEHPILLTAAENHFKVNGVAADDDELLEDYDLEDGAFVIMSDLSSSVWNTPITPASYMPMPVDATIDASEIEYWVGTGEQSAVIAVSWGNPDTALAWGLHFTGTPTVSQAINALVAADSRLSVDDASAISNIMYNDSASNTHLQFQSTMSGNYLQFILNGNGNAGWTSTLGDGSFLKIGESAFGVGYDSVEFYGYWYPSGVVWPTEVHPVNDPADTATSDIPVDATIAASDILYWVGTGANEMVFAVNWADSALAWGYRFASDSVTVQTVMNDIQAADPRFSYVSGSWSVDDILFVENGDTLKLEGYYWLYNLNGHSAPFGYNMQYVHNTDIVKWGDPSVGVGYNYDTTYAYYQDYAWTGVIHPVSVPDTTPSETPVDATIAVSDILYWVGTGSNQAIVAVNWAAPDTCLAWGVKWQGDATLKDLMDTMADADPRFSYTANGSFLYDIFFVENGDTLKLTTYSASEWGNYWSFLVNGEMGMSYFNAQAINNADFVKWGDPNSGDTAAYDEWGYPILVWTTNVTPVIVPEVEPEHGPYCGAVGTEGCEAVPANSTDIVAWATACTVTRGPQNIADESSQAVTYGSDSMAVGAVSMTDNLNVVSLGDGGSAMLTFAQPIVNGDGFDFAVFENSFGDNFLELAYVEVSSDGVNFVRFPAVSLTQTEVQTGGMGTTDPTMINNLAGKYRMGWGTPFDLDELRDSAFLDVNNVTHVRIVDVVGSIDPRYGTRDSRGNLVNDPWPTDNDKSGFDLAGVAVMHQADASSIDDLEAINVMVYPNPTQGMVSIVLDRMADAELFDLTGRQVAAYRFAEGTNSISLEGMEAGVYVLRMAGTVVKIVKK